MKVHSAISKLLSLPQRIIKRGKPNNTNTRNNPFMIHILAREKERKNFRFGIQAQLILSGLREWRANTGLISRCIKGDYYLQGDNVVNPFALLSARATKDGGRAVRFPPQRSFGAANVHLNGRMLPDPGLFVASNRSSSSAVLPFFFFFLFPFSKQGESWGGCNPLFYL